MRTKYNVNENELIVNFDFYYDIYDNQNKVKSIRKYINQLLTNNNIKFNGNKIIVYKDGILIGIFYLTNYYLNKLNYNIKNNYLNENNSYFYENSYIEINSKKEFKTKKILSLY